jgi:glycosyltransferase involved in cell wall biosynthesis
MAKVDIIIPTHSRPQLLERAVKSARSAGREIRIIVVDDASTDETAVVCRRMEDITYIRLESNQGVAAARNAGIAHSSAAFIAFLDDDDLRLPGSLDRQIAMLEGDEGRAGMVCGNRLLGDDECRPYAESKLPTGIEPNEMFWRFVSFSFPAMPSSTVVRRECFARAGMFNPALAGIDDWDIWTRIAEHYPVLIDPEPACIYRYPSPASGQGSSRLAKHYLRAAHHQSSFLLLPRALAASGAQRRRARRIALTNMANELLFDGWTNIKLGEWRAAAEDVLIASRLNPFWIKQPHIYRALYSRLREFQTRRSVNPT